MSTNSNNGYFHTTPGRVRVRVTCLKGKNKAARSLELLLSSQPGVKATRANPLTGNVLVTFDTRAMSCEDVLRSLADLGHLPIVTDINAEVDLVDSRLCEIGLCVGRNLAKIALKQALGGTTAGILLELL